MEKGRAKSSKGSKGAAATSDNKCTVCHKSFCEPKLLPCGHLMCRKCLLSWLKQTRHATCPYCRYPILKNDTEPQALPASSASKKEAAHNWEQATEWDSEDTLQRTVDKFPTDLSMEVAVKAEQVLNQKKKNCHVCDEPATVFCFHCGDTLCGACRNMHSKLAVTRHHVVEELNGLTAKRLADFQPPSPCPQHPEEPCRLFCPQHNTSLCVLCATSRHRECQQVSEFDQLVEKSKKKLAVLLKKLRNSSTEIENAVTELDQHLADTEQSTEAALADIQRLKTQLTKAVEDRCQQMVLQASAARADIREEVKEAKTILLGRQSRLASHATLARRVQDSTAHVVVCGMTSVMEARLKELDCHVQLPTTAKAITKTTLVVEKSASRKLEDDLAKLGQIKVEFAAIAASVAGTFHSKHGPGVTLSNRDRTAALILRNNGCRSVVVKSEMTVGIVTEVQVHVDVTQWNHWQICPRVGVITQSPDTLNLQQIQWSNVQQIWSNVQQMQALRCYPNFAQENQSNPKQQFYCQEGKAYETGGGWYQEARQAVGQAFSLNGQVVLQSRLGVCLDNSFSLHLYIDGMDCGNFPSKIQQPCYVLFELGDIKEITLLPPRKI